MLPEKAIRFPSGDQLGHDAERSPVLSSVAPLPSAAIVTNRCGVRALEQVGRSRDAGEQQGERSGEQKHSRAKEPTTRALELEEQPVEQPIGELGPWVDRSLDAAE